MKKLLILAIALVAALSISSCSKDNPKITNTLTYDGKSYKVDFMAIVNPDNTFDSDIHFLEESSLEEAWSMMWAVGKLGSYTLPAQEADFMLTKNTYPDYSIDFKSGKADIWLDEGNHVCLVADGVLTDGKKFKLSVRSTNE
ncbi:MAG: hypothetical protein K6A64_00645 [Bacteroidales bacterium]|nr:hypothetical protein [Bacteroidales bacterium]